MLRTLISLLLVALLAACTSNPGHMPTGAQSYALIPPPASQTRPDEYRIGALDELSISVFQEPDLSIKEVPVDASGNIIMPLIGQVEASGKTARELSADIAQRLAARYLVNPQVSLIVTKSVSQRVTVEGQVAKPGVYEIEGRTTLLRSIALAEGPTGTAALNEVAIFRTVGDKRYAARFDLKAIRNGQAPDPEIRGQDVVVVGFSGLKSAYRNVLQTLPTLGAVFVALLQ